MSAAVLAARIFPASFDSAAALGASSMSLPDDLVKSCLAFSAMPLSPRMSAAPESSSASSLMLSSSSAPPPAIWLTAAEKSAFTLLSPALSVCLPSGTSEGSRSSIFCTSSRSPAVADRWETSMPDADDLTSSFFSPSESASSSATERRTEIMFDE